MHAKSVRANVMYKFFINGNVLEGWGAFNSKAGNLHFFPIAFITAKLNQAHYLK